MKFGEFLKQLRIRRELGLREFCSKHGHDPSRWSKIERGLLSPPSDEKTLSLWAKQLGLKKDSAEWFQLFDLAFAERGRIPNDLLSDEELVKKLPLFFRTIRGNKPTEGEMKELAEKLRREI